MVDVLLLFPLVSHKLHIVRYKAYMFSSYIYFRVQDVSTLLQSPDIFLKSIDFVFYVCPRDVHISHSVHNLVLRSRAVVHWVRVHHVLLARIYIRQKISLAPVPSALKRYTKRPMRVRILYRETLVLYHMYQV